MTNDHKGVCRSAPPKKKKEKSTCWESLESLVPHFPSFPRGYAFYLRCYIEKWIYPLYLNKEKKKLQRFMVKSCQN